MAYYDVVIAFDTETSGLGPNAEILELGIVHYYKGHRVREWSSFFCPQTSQRDDPNVQKALSVNGLDWGQLQTAPTFRSMVEEIEHEMSEAIWVAHNSEFDLRLLRQEHQRLGHTPRHPPQLVLCTKLLDFIINPGKEHYRLGDVTERWGVKPENAHRAIVDAQACGDVFSKMVERGLIAQDIEQARQLMQTADKRWRGRPKGVW